MIYLRAIFTIFKKDLVAERRSREVLSSMLVFALIAIIIFIFSFELAVDVHAQAFAGTLWVSLCFSGTLGLNRSFGMERENNCLDGLLLAPVDPTAIYFGKTLANWVFLLTLAVILLPIAGLFYGIDPFSWGLAGIILLGTLGYSLSGTLLAAIAVRLHNRELFLPILLFPVLIPLLLSVIRATNVILNGAGSEVGTWVLMLAGYAVLFLAVGLMLFDEVVVE